jgi:hypothetical protein
MRHTYTGRMAMGDPVKDSFSKGASWPFLFLPLIKGRNFFYKSLTVAMA